MMLKTRLRSRSPDSTTLWMVPLSGGEGQRVSGPARGLHHLPPDVEEEAVGHGSGRDPKTWPGVCEEGTTGEGCGSLGETLLAGGWAAGAGGGRRGSWARGTETVLRAVLHALKRRLLPP